jgi:hypothetical protein
MNATLYSSGSLRTSPHSVCKLFVLALCFSAAAQVLAQPRILQQPANESVSLGATAQFTVLVRSSDPGKTYQWMCQDALPGATNANLILTNVGLSDAGTYRVAVSDLSGTTESDPALLDVDPTFTKGWTSLDLMSHMAHRIWNFFKALKSVTLVRCLAIISCDAMVPP